MGGTYSARSIGFALVAMLVAPAVAKPPAGPSPRPAVAQPALAAEFDAYLKAAVRHDQFTGAVLVARDGVPLFRRGYGMANYELGVPSSPSNAYVLASLAKQFTAMAIMQLREQGKLAVTDPICKYLKDCPAAWRRITIRHLLTHSSGIPNFSSLPDWDENLGRRTYRHGELVALFRDLPLQFVPGEKFKYSNSGYYLLALLIQQISAKPYAQVLGEGIFTPLGMTHTVYHDGRGLIPGMATGYYSRGTSFVNAPLSDPTSSLGGGAIVSTVGDLLRWDQALYGDRLLPRAAREEMFTPVIGGYGYGWRIDEKFGRRRIEHSGDERGFSTYIARFPADRVTVIVLSNSERTSAGKAGTNLAAITFGAPYTRPTAQARDIVWDTITRDGVSAAIRQFDTLRRATPARVDANADTLIELGYELIDVGKLDEAVAIFRFCLGVFPPAAYAYDGLADVAIARDDEAAAINYFRQSLKLDAGNDYATNGLAKLEKGNN